MRHNTYSRYDSADRRHEPRSGDRRTAPRRDRRQQAPLGGYSAPPAAPPWRRRRSDGSTPLMAALLGGMVIAVVFVLGVSYHLSDWHWHEQLGAHASAWSRRGGGGGPSPSAPSADDGAGPASAVPDAAAGGGATAAHDANAQGALPLGADEYALEHAEPECAELLKASQKVMFMIVGGRGYHDLRVKTMLSSWARCVCHVLVFTDPSVDVSECAARFGRNSVAIRRHSAQFMRNRRAILGRVLHAARRYLSEHRFVYLAAGDAWKKRPYLPMSHMDAVGKIINRPHSPAAAVQVTGCHCH